MNLKEFINNKVKTGVNVEFAEANGKTGKVILALVDNNKFVLNSSIENYQRFKKWIGEKSTADIRKTGKFFKTEYGFLPTIEIRTTVKVEDDGKNIEQPKEKEYSDWIF